MLFNLFNNSEPSEISEPSEKSTKRWVLVVFAIVLSVFLLSVILLAGRNGEEPVQQPEMNIADDSVAFDGQQNEKKASDGFIEIPFFSQLYVYEDMPNVYLNNPSTNHVYFQYDVSDEDGNVLFDEDVMVEPGKAIPVDFWSILDAGEHAVSIDISSFDMETGEPRNGAHQEAVITVEK